MRHRLAVILPASLLIYSISYVLAYLLRFEFEPSPARWALWSSTLPFVLVVKFLSAWIWREYPRSLRFMTVGDVLVIAATSGTSAMVLWLGNFLWEASQDIPRSIICIDACLTFLLVGGFRASYRLTREVMGPYLRRRGRKKTLIYGVGQPSVSIVRMLNATSTIRQGFCPVGFVADQQPQQSLIGGLKVHALSPETPLSEIVRRTKARQLLIPGNTPGRIVRELLRDCLSEGIKVHVIPTVDDVVDGRYKLAARDVTVSDLLRREPNQLDMAAIQEYVTGKRVLVTGGAGSIGSELCRQILALRPEMLIVYDQSEYGMFCIEREFAARSHPKSRIRYIVADVLDENALSQTMQSFQPQLVFHAAAYKHVPLMEDNPQSAVTNNILGTKAVADAAAKSGVERFVLISTDKAVRPTSVMGASKLIAEKYVQALSQTSQTKFITVRFGNVLNSMGSVVPTFRKQIEQGGPITVTHPEMKRFFMTIPEAVQLVLQAGAIGPSGGVLILDMGEPVRIVDLAKDMIMLSGLKYPDDIDIVFTGMRPGEKLYEELFYSSESGARKIHEKIYCGDSETALPLPAVLSDIRYLEEAAADSRKASLHAFQEVVAKYSDTEWVPSRLAKAA